MRSVQCSVFRSVLLLTPTLTLALSFQDLFAWQSELFTWPREIRLFTKSFMSPPPEKKSILLVNPWIHDFAAYDLWMKPLGLLYIGSILRSRGYSVHLLDCLHFASMPAPRRESGKPPQRRDFGCGHIPLSAFASFHLDIARGKSYGRPLPVPAKVLPRSIPH